MEPSWMGALTSRGQRANWLLSALPLRVQQEGGSLKPGGELTSKCDRAGTLLSDLQPPEVWEIVSVVYKPHSLKYFIMTDWIKTCCPPENLLGYNVVNQLGGNERKIMNSYIPTSWKNQFSRVLKTSFITQNCKFGIEDLDWNSNSITSSCVT